jgi:hypothetical protein
MKLKIVIVVFPLPYKAMKALIPTAAIVWIFK